MVAVAIYSTETMGARADVESHDDVVWLSIKTKSGGEVSIYGRREHIEKFRMMADIFNDAFAPEEAKRAKMIAAHNAAIESGDLPF